MATAIGKAKEDLYPGEKHPDTTGWKDRHIAALADVAETRQLRDLGIEGAVSMMALGVLAYEHATRARYESEIGADGVLGEPWAEIAEGVRALLNGETGRLDCGTMDGALLSALKRQGFRCKDCGEPREAGRCVACTE